MGFLKWILSFVRRPKKARSFEELVDLIFLHRCTMVFGRMKIAYPMAPVTGSSERVGRIGTFRFSIELESRGQDGRLVKYEERCGEYKGSERGVAESDERSLVALQALSTLDLRLQKLVKRLPDLHLSTNILVQGDRPMTDQELREMRRQAKQFEVSTL